METWILILELEFPVLDEDTKEKYVGDCEEDFARRALERMRPTMDKLLEDSEFTHYHILPTKKGIIRRR